MALFYHEPPPERFLTDEEAGSALGQAGHLQVKVDSALTEQRATDAELPELVLRMQLLQPQQRRETLLQVGQGQRLGRRGDTSGGQTQRACCRTVTVSRC